MTMKWDIQTPEERAIAEAKIDALKAHFPMDYCRELVKLTWDAEQAKLMAEDAVFAPALEGPELAEVQSDLDNPDFPEEAKAEMRTLLSFMGKKASEMPQCTPEQDAEYVDELALTAADRIFESWLNALYFARYQFQDNPVRLDSSLLPPPELTSIEGFSLEEATINSLVLSVDQLRQLMLRFAANLIPVFNEALAIQPEGFPLTEDIIICKDADGFYIQPKVKE